MMFKKKEGDMVYWYYSEDDYNMANNFSNQYHKLQLASIVINTRKNELIKMRYGLEEFIDAYFDMMGES